MALMIILKCCTQGHHYLPYLERSLAPVHRREERVNDIDVASGDTLAFTYLAIKLQLNG